MIKLLQEAILNLDKSEWEPTKFGEVAYEPKENSKDPAKDGLNHKVGLEHIDSEDVHLRRSANIGEGSTFTKVFRKGDVLFGRRRAYLKKAARADFDGICSGDITVLRTNDKILPELLPFLVNNEKFFDYAVKHSAGGLSPRVKYKDLANYEFLLPPKDQQAQLAELLWAMDEVIERELSTIETSRRTTNSFFNHKLFASVSDTDKYFGNRKSKYPVKKLGGLLDELQYGISESLSEHGQIPILRMNNLQNGKLNLDDLKYYNPKKGELDKFMLRKGDVLFNRTNSFDLVGKVSLFDKDGEYSFASYLIRLKCDEKRLNPSFLNFYLNTPLGFAKIRKYRTPGVSQSNINAQNLKSIPLPLPSIETQNEIMRKVESLQRVEFLSTSRLECSKSLQKSLINQIF